MRLGLRFLKCTWPGIFEINNSALYKNNRLASVKLFRFNEWNTSEKYIHKATHTAADMIVNN